MQPSNLSALKHCLRQCAAILVVQFASYRQSAVGKGSGVPIELEYFAVYEVNDGTVVRTRQYLDRDTALEAAGLQM